MLVLSAIVEILKFKGVLTSQEALEIKDLYTLSAVLEGKASLLMSPEEQTYLGQVKFALTEGLYSQVQELESPESLGDFKEILVRAIPALKRTGRTEIL